MLILIMPELIIEAREAFISEAMAVRRILPFRAKRMVGPFIFMDHAGPVQNSGAGMPSLDVLPHPHIGLSTVTYLFGGAIMHRDSLGVQQLIKPGEVNWMTAGSGISHSERFEGPEAFSGGLELLQTWVALPEEFEEVQPDFHNFKEHQLPVFAGDGVWHRLIAGEAFGVKSPVATYSPMLYLHVELAPGATFSVPENYTERGVYVVKGSVEHGQQRYYKSQLAVFSKGEQVQLEALEPAILMVLGGEPLGQRHIWWNFVSSKKERIEQAKADWLAGRIDLPPTDNKEFVPLPEDKRKSDGGAVGPNALS